MSKAQTKVKFSQVVFEYVVQKIVNGEFYPSMRIIERDLVVELKISRIPVREALVMLVNESWVLKDEKGKVTVARVTEKDIREIFQLREGIEGIAARESAHLIKASELEQLARELEILNKNDQKNESISLIADSRIVHRNNKKEKISFNEDIRIAHRNADIHFHKIVVDSSGNERIKRIFTSVIRQSQSFFYIRAAAEIGLDASIFSELVSHQQIYDAIASQNGELADTLMRRHIRNGCEAIITVKKVLNDNF